MTPPYELINYRTTMQSKTICTYHNFTFRSATINGCLFDNNLVLF